MVKIGQKSVKKRSEMDEDGQTCQKRFKTVKIVKNGGSGQKQSIIIENGPKIG